MLYAVDREIFARTNIRLLNFRVVLFSSPQHTGSVASFVLFDNFLNWFGDWSNGTLYQVGYEFTNKVDLDRSDVSVDSLYINLVT